MIKTPCEGVGGGSRVSEKGMQRLKVMGEDYGHVSIFLQAEATVYVLGIKCLAPEWPPGELIIWIFPNFYLGEFTASSRDFYNNLLDELVSFGLTVSCSSLPFL